MPKPNQTIKQIQLTPPPFQAEMDPSLAVEQVALFGSDGVALPLDFILGNMNTYYTDKIDILEAAVEDFETRIAALESP